jgi:hypothetical protein
MSANVATHQAAKSPKFDIEVLDRAARQNSFAHLARRYGPSLSALTGSQNRLLHQLRSLRF